MSDLVSGRCVDACSQALLGQETIVIRAWLFWLTILLASTTSLGGAHADGTCWHPGMSRLPGIAERSCRTSEAGTHNRRHVRGHSVGQRPQRRHPKLRHHSTTLSARSPGVIVIR